MRKFLIVYKTKDSTGNCYFTTPKEYPTQSDLQEVCDRIASERGLNTGFGNVVVTGIYELSTNEGLSNA